jgi:hypothetical protein
MPVTDIQNLKLPDDGRKTAGTFCKGNKTFWEELIAYFPLITHGPHRERDNYGDTQIQRGVLIIYTRSRCLGTMERYTFLDTTRATLKTTRPTVPTILLRVYSLPR